MKGDKGFTAIFAHLSEFSNLKVGDKVTYGTYLGKMGNTGVGTGAHLHLGVVLGRVTTPWWLAEATPYRTSRLTPSQAQLNYFKGMDLFKNKGKWYPCKVTTEWAGYTNHYALDLVDDNKIYDSMPEIYWNRTFNGEVVDIGDFGDARYGKYIMVNYGDEFGRYQQQPTPAPTNAELEAKVKTLETQVNNLNNKIKKAQEVLGG